MLLFLILSMIILAIGIVYVTGRTKPSVVVPVKVIGTHPYSPYIVGQVMYADTEDLDQEAGHIVRCYNPELHRHVFVNNLNLEVLGDAESSRSTQELRTI